MPSSGLRYEKSSSARLLLMMQTVFCWLMSSSQRNLPLMMGMLETLARFGWVPMISAGRERSLKMMFSFMSRWGTMPASSGMASCMDETSLRVMP